MSKIRIMSNNVWWCDSNTPAWETAGADCSALVRAAGFARVYRELMPDVIGLQECSARMCHAIMTELSAAELPYAMLWGRDTPIIYRSDRFSLIDSAFRIYPEEVPGYEGVFNNLKTKSYCAAVFMENMTGRIFIAGTTHLWYKSANPASPSYQQYSEEAKEYQMNLFIDKVEELRGKYLNSPAVIMGDLNTYYRCPAVQTAINRGFAHAYDTASGSRDETCGMHRCGQSGYEKQLNPGGFDVSLDHILTRGLNDGAVLCFERYYPDYYAPLSDHSPAYIDIEL